MMRVLGMVFVSIEVSCYSTTKGNVSVSILVRLTLYLTV
jgi:hypothetical protein